MQLLASTCSRRQRAISEKILLADDVISSRSIMSAVAGQ